MRCGFIAHRVLKIHVLRFMFYDSSTKFVIGDAQLRECRCMVHYYITGHGNMAYG
jgi:nitrous oxidase accessory protein NosD